MGGYGSPKMHGGGGGGARRGNPLSHGEFKKYQCHMLSNYPY